LATTKKEEKRVMNAIQPNARRMLRSKRGANMVEYIILVGVVALLAIGGFGLFKGSVVKKITSQGTQVENVEQGQ